MTSLRMLCWCAQVCMWTVAVVDRLVCRNNTALTSVQAAAQIFVEGWTAFAAALMRKAAQSKLASEGEQDGNLKVHKRENFLGSDIEICTFS